MESLTPLSSQLRQKITAAFFKTKAWVVAHKILTSVIVVAVALVLFFVLRAVFKKPAQNEYVLGMVTKGDIVASVTGTGQVSASNEVDITPEVSGKITHVYVHSGQTVSRGQLLVQIDSTDAAKNVRDAKIALQTAEIDFNNAVADYNTTKASEERTVADSQVNFNSTVKAIADDQNKDTNVLDISGAYQSDIQGRYTIETYKCSGGVCIKYSGLESGTSSIVANIPKALGTRGLYYTFSAVPSAGEYWYIDVPTASDSSYYDNQQSLADAQINAAQSLDSAQRSVDSKKIALTQKQNALADAEDTLAKYSVRAPFSGTIGTFIAQEYDSASGSLGTIITNQNIASLTLNEVDVAKVRPGEKATLTFDAVDGLSIAGTVFSVDSVGAVSQGVVNYTVKIAFDTEDARVKPGMTVTAAIITDVHQNVLSVPAAAVKTSGGRSYVEEIDNPVAATDGTQNVTSATAPRRVPVEVGLSSDSSVEILSGVAEGDTVIVRTIAAPTTKPKSSAPSIIGGSATRSGGAGAARALGGNRGFGG